jgi:hypothetical protein
MHTIFVRAATALAVWVGVAACETGVSQASPAVADESGVYAAVLENLAFVGREVTVIGDSTVAIAAQDPSLQRELPVELRAGFMAANQAPRSLAGVSFPSGFALAPSLGGRRMDDQEAYWNTFFERYPRSNGWIHVSAIGYSSDLSRAVVYVSHQCPGLCGSGDMLILRRDGPAWRVEQLIPVWIS